MEHLYLPAIICFLTNDRRYPNPHSSKSAPESDVLLQTNWAANAHAVEGPEFKSKWALRDPKPPPSEECDSSGIFHTARLVSLFLN